MRKKQILAYCLLESKKKIGGNHSFLEISFGKNKSKNPKFNTYSSQTN